MLSGGGAKGLVHIGVIEVMDSLGIRPDLVVGTRQLSPSNPGEIGIYESPAAIARNRAVSTAQLVAAAASGKNMYPKRTDTLS